MGKGHNIKGQRGFSLIEVLIALGIMAAIVPAFLASLSVTSRAIQISDEQIQAEALVRSQLDTILAASYNLNCYSTPDTCYPVTVSAPQYSISIITQILDTPTCSTDNNCDTLQKVTASVSRPTGDGGYRPILAVSTYKMKKI